METKDYAAIAETYARNVLSGEVFACRSIRLQAARFIEDLEAQKKADFPFVFNTKKAAKICAFIECLPHTKGRWARSKQLLTLEPWQIWIFAMAFGWLRKSDGLRRYRVLYVVVPRKNGKSVIAAGVGLFMFCMDGEHGAEVYSGATTEKQAWEVFKPARLMTLRSPQLVSAAGIEVNAKSLVKHGDQSVFETITGDPGDGQSPSCSIHDEYHEHADDGQVETMITGMGAREQPLQLIITTAGDNLAGPCYASILEEREKLDGIGTEDGKFPLDHETLFIEYTIDEEDDWKSEAALRKANPNLGVSVGDDWLFSRQRDAIRTPRKSGVFKTKHLNLWVAAKQAYFDVEAWRRCKRDWLPTRSDDLIKLELLRGRRAIAALDLASKIDIAALELLICPKGDKASTDDPYISAGWYFVPEERVPEVPAYEGWDKLDLLSVTPGNIIDYDEILEKMGELRTIFQLECIPYDPHQATMLATTASKDGYPMLEYRQIVLNMSEPMKELDALMRAGRIAHGGCPVAEWQINNVIGALDKKDNVYPNKPRAEAKIDNPVAKIMALGVAMTKEEEVAATSPWDDPEYELAGSQEGVGG